MRHLVLAVTLLFPVIANSGDKVRQQKAHLHGTATLNIVVDGNIVGIELESPAYNLVGFEHAPNNDTQQQAIDNAKATLKDTSNLFAFVADAGCNAVESEVEWASEHEDHKAGNQEDDHAEEDHDADHDEKEHAAEEGDHDAEAGEHSEFHAAYLFECTNIDSLKHVDAILFERFEYLESIEVQMISRLGQSAVQLDADSTRIPVR